MTVKTRKLMSTNARPSSIKTLLKVWLTTLEILLVRKHHEQAIAHLPVCQDPVQLLSRLVYTIPILRINDKDQSL